MTGIVLEKTMRSGISYLYIKLSYKDAKTQKWKSKWIPTGLTAKGNKKRAKALLPEILKQYSYLEYKGNDINMNIDHDILLIDYLDSWLDSKKRDLEQSTYEGYCYRIAHIKDYFKPKNLKLRDVSSNVINTYLLYELDFGKVNPKTGERGPLSIRTVRSRRSILLAVFNQAIIDGLICQNPVNAVTIRGKRNSNFTEEELFLTEEEVTDLLKFLSIEYPRLLPIAFFGAYLGVRRSELLGLRWSSVNFQKKTINIENTVVKVRSIIEKQSTKTKSSHRQLPLFENAYKCLMQIKQEQEKYREFFGNAYKATGDYIFTKEDGSCYDPDLLSKQFARATKKYGRPEISLHNLRHSCASMAINRGWDVKQLQYWLGHSDIQTTLNIYAHYDKQRLDKVGEDMNKISSNAVQLFQANPL